MKRARPLPRRPTVEGLEARPLLASGFFVGGEAVSPFGGGNLAEILRVDPTTGAVSLLTQFLQQQGFVQRPSLAKLEGLALEPSGSLIAVGPAATCVAPAGTFDVYRVRTDTGTVSLLTRFTPLGLNSFALLNRVDDVAVAPNGDIVIAGAGVSSPASPVAPRIVRVNPASGAQTVVTEFLGRAGFTTVATLDRLDGLTVLPDGTIVALGFGGDFGSTVKSARLIRVNPATGAQAVFSRFQGGGFGQFPLLSEATGVSSTPDGRVLVSGLGLDIPSAKVLARVVSVDAATGAQSILKTFPPVNSGGPLIDRATAVTFAPVAATALVGGIKRVPNVGNLVDFGIGRLFKVNPSNSSTTQVALFGAGTPGPLVRLTAVAAGPALDDLIPPVTIKNPAVARSGRAVSFRFRVPRATSLARFTYRVDWDGDGTIDQTVIDASRTLSLRHTFATPGETTPVVSVVNASGVSSSFVAGRLRIRGN